jgi:hypothetical protein
MSAAFAALSPVQGRRWLDRRGCHFAADGVITTVPRRHRREYRDTADGTRDAAGSTTEMGCPSFMASASLAIFLA